MNIPWIIVFIVFTILIQRFIFTKWGLTQIKYERFFKQHSASVGEKIEMIDEISNDKFLPVPWLRLESKINANLHFIERGEIGEYHRTLFSLKPYQKITRRHQITCKKRGYYQLNSVSMTVGDIFGFGNTLKVLPSQSNLTVYPEIINIENIPLPSHSYFGEVIVRRWIMEDPFVSAGTREYNYGDPLNKVNWKATSRTGSMQVNKSDFTADHHLMIYLNFDQSEDGWLPIEDEKLIETGITYAGSIAQYAINKGICTGFGTNSYTVDSFKDSVRITPSYGKGQLINILGTLAKLKMNINQSFDQYLKEDVNRKVKGRDILLITSYLSDKVANKIKELEAFGNRVEIVWLSEDHIPREGVHYDT